MRENPKPFEVYRHFKGNLYQILTLATDSESGSPMVVYQAMYGDFKVYVRPLDMFMSRVDKEKYPDVTCEMRFEKMDVITCTESTVGMETRVPGKAANVSEIAGETVIPDETVIPGEAVTETTDGIATEAAAAAEAPPDLDPLVLAFLEASRVEERINILAALHHRITDDMINTLAVVMDVEVNEGPVEERYQELKNCLLMKQKFEKVRY